MKFDQVNTSECVSLWPIIDCLLAPSPRVKQKSRLLKNLQKSQVSLHHPSLLHSSILMWLTFCLLVYFDKICSAFRICLWENPGEALTSISCLCPNDDPLTKPKWLTLLWWFTAKIWLDTKYLLYSMLGVSCEWQEKKLIHINVLDSPYSYLKLKWNHFFFLPKPSITLTWFLLNNSS